MSLSTEERAEMQRKLAGLSCLCCGGAPLARDDGITSKAANKWGVSGAYVVCDYCGLEFDPPIEAPAAPGVSR